MKKFMRPRPADPCANGGGAPRDAERRSSLSSSGGSPAPALWEDPEFPVAAAGLCERRTRWLRPHELCARPRFLGDSGAGGEQAARWRVAPGEAGDAALCRAAAALALTPALLARVAQPQSFRAAAGYRGRFRFRFWVFGEWRDVLVDDRLPARGARLLASRGAPDDFTLPLLEKAYAKLLGGYARLRAGDAADALRALTGAAVQSFAPPRQPRALLLQVLLAAVPRSTLLLAGAAADGGGLLARQAYCVTGLARVRGAPDDCAVLLRLRAPGARGEWTGAWARDSPQRRALPAADRELLERRAAAPGTFWMPLGDFARAFARLELAHVGPDDWLREPALHAKRPWRAVLARRRWRRGVSAGGPPGAPTAHANPHFVLRVPPADGPCHVVVSVAQERARRPLGVGFAVYALADDAAPRRARPPQRALDVTHCSRAPEVATFFTLPPGQYLVVPHAHRAHAEAAFLLRVLTDERTDVWELNDDNALQAPDAAGAAEPAVRAAAAALAGADAARELDAAALRARLRRVWRRVLPARPSAELCRALVALCDGALGGRARAGELAALAARLALWRAALRSLGARRRLSSYRLRELLAACGASASNKVLEALVLRYARGAALDADACMVALARLHLAHERFRSLDSKLKSNPLSLEEMILMTIYS